MNKKILYVDNFDLNNSNTMWLQAFRKNNKVMALDIRKNRDVLGAVNSFDPCVVHFGGSVKVNSYVSLDTIKKIRTKVPLITSFYGDIYHNPYVIERAKIIDMTLVSNGSMVNTYSKIFYSPCPAYIPEYKEYHAPEFDVAFIGNNHNTNRCNFIKKIASKYRTVVWGKGWGNVKNITYKGQCPISESYKCYQLANVIVDDSVEHKCRHTGINLKCSIGKDKFYKRSICNNTECPSFEPTYKYFSNRIFTAMVSGRPFLAVNRPGQREVITSVLYYSTIDECFSKIDMLLRDKELRDVIAKSSYIEANSFSYEKVIDRLIGTSS